MPPSPSAEALPFARVYSIADPLPGKAVIAIVVSSIVLSIVATITLASGDDYVRAGRANAAPPFLFSVSDMGWFAAWILSTSTIIVVYAQTRGRVRWLAAGGLVAILVAVPSSCAHRPYPDDAYLAGFATWTGTHVDADAVRKWHASRPAVAAPLTLTPALYPPSVAALGPDAVEQHPTGIILQWGHQASWSSSRKVFVGANESSAPPLDLFHLWHQVRPGLYAARGSSN